MFELLMRALSSSSSVSLQGASVVRGKHRVAVLGAAGGIGQPLSLLLKLAPQHIRHLALYDIANMGMAADLAHIDTTVTVSAHSGEAELAAALQGCDIVLLPAGVPRKPGMTRDDLFAVNAKIVRSLAAAVARTCPQAHLLVISNPVNSTVPIAFETMRALGVVRPSVLGVTTLDIVRARTFVAQALSALHGENDNAREGKEDKEEVIDPAKLDITVAGGHSGPTIVPLLSGFQLPELSVQEITQRVQYGGDEVVKAKAGSGSATLAMAHAARLFLDGFVRGLDGPSPSRVVTMLPREYLGDSGAKGTEPGMGMGTGDSPWWWPRNMPYLTVPVEIGPGGVQRVLPLPEMNAYERQLWATAMEQLGKDIRKGQDFVSSTNVPGN